MLMTNSLNFSLSDHFFFSLSFLKDSFLRYGIRGLQFFSFSTWKIFWHFLLQGLGEESVFIQTDGSYCCTFPLVAFKVFSLLLVSPDWVIMGLGVDWLICLGFTSLLRSLGLFFHQIWENFRRRFFRYSLHSFLHLGFWWSECCLFVWFLYFPTDC